jgi:hypothetical protein
MESDATYVMDRGYDDYRRMDQMDRIQHTLRHADAGLIVSCLALNKKRLL